MKQNSGFRPSQLRSIQQRGLTKVLTQWRDLVRQGTPHIRNPEQYNRFHQCYSIFYASVRESLCSDDKRFDAQKVREAIDELKSFSNDDVKDYANELEVFVQRFINTAGKQVIV
ncbi:hypothetical protein [Pseudoalteromonas rubra]|nr:hypothetical protein [Pseudoalteromonas rubra]